MKIDATQLAEWADEARRTLQREAERLREQAEQIDIYLRALDAAQTLATEAERLRAELEQERTDTGRLTAELEQEREQRQALEMKLNELNKLSAGMAKKSSSDNLLKAISSYLKISKRKTLAKRETAKVILMELFANAQVEIPDDINELLNHLDDEQPDAPTIVIESANDVIAEGGQKNVRIGQ